MDMDANGNDQETIPALVDAHGPVGIESRQAFYLAEGHGIHTDYQSCEARFSTCSNNKPRFTQHVMLVSRDMNVWYV